jgi:small-conductance mechanosensitive channel
MSFFGSEFYGNEIWRWFVALGVIIFVWLVLRGVVRFVIHRLRRVVTKTPTKVDDLVVDLLYKTRFVFVFVLSIYAGSLILTLPDVADRILRTLFVLALLFQAGYWGNEFVGFWIGRSVKRKLSNDAEAATTMAAFGFIGKVAIWSVIILVGLDNLGVNITGLVTGLGISGIAVALAVQNILKDLFASLSILVDKPFVIGDFIIVGDLMGTVEKVGLKSTRVRSLSGEQIIFSNGDLLESRVRNYKRMYERRVVFTIGVVYQTSADVMEAIPALIRGIVEAQARVRFDRCHFRSFDASSLTLEAVYYVLDSDYNVYMDTQQAINLGILRAFEERGIEMAYPTQTLYLQSEGPSQEE